MRDLTPAQQDLRQRLGAGANSAAGAALVGERIAIAEACPSLDCPRAGACGPILGVPGSSTCSCPPCHCMRCQARAAGTGRDLINAPAARPAQLELHPIGAPEDLHHAA